MIRSLAVVLLSVGFVFSPLFSIEDAVRADEVELVNGDLFTAKIISLDEKQLKVKSELLGELTIDRAKVRQITLGERLPPAAAVGSRSLAPHTKNTAAAPTSLEDLLKQLQKSGGAAQLTPEEVIKQFEAAGGDAAELAELKKNMPLFAAPEVQAYFHKQVGGLLDGSLKIDDIRNEAIRARNETKAMVKDFGPEVEAALAPYLGILEKFINDTAPTAKSPAAPGKEPK